MKKFLPKVIRVSTVPISLDKLLEGQLNFLSKHYQVIGVSSANGDHLKKVGVRESVQVVPVEMQRGIHLLQDLQSLYKLVVLFKKEKPTLVHSITPKAGLLSMLAAKIARVPNRLHTFTGLIFPSKTGFFQFVLIQMDRLLCKVATNVYPEGVGVKNDLIKYKITDKPLKILANGNVNGIDTSYFEPKLFRQEEIQTLREDLVISSTDFVFVFVGRLVGDKGINELVAAFKNLSEQEDDREIKLLLVGPLEQELDPLLPITLQEIKQNANIVSVGYQEDVRPYFAISQALVFPSYREGFPNVVMQAGAMELPSIVTDINGCNEIINHQVNGLIIPVKNIELLEKAMNRLLEEQQLYRQLQLHSRKMIADRYERARVWKALLDEYNLLLS
ncbi:Glycosyltransferase involved in cell wall bisynthesis [Mesonia phycicola]|uniref:Glycosyltransferase involved in cell wall bisynthesis n=1 Tax=Mesonia phycicola TaxID=579105 RepID=A0A1M6H2R8_9FLAO|nr:glycosyltransferase family 4 protein [Mesonia phycicola]SHJ16501.1 Glycosyltransferase involved in cell wall bisynthesis [Mesonia phycicola]